MRCTENNDIIFGVHPQIKPIKSFVVLAVIRRSLQRVGGAHLRVIAPGQHSSFRRNVAAVPAVGKTVSDLTGPRFERPTSCSKEERVIARPTGRCMKLCKCFQRPTCRGNRTGSWNILLPKITEWRIFRRRSGRASSTGNRPKIACELCLYEDASQREAETELDLTF